MGPGGWRGHPLVNHYKRAYNSPFGGEECVVLDRRFSVARPTLDWHALRITHSTHESTTQPRFRNTLGVIIIIKRHYTTKAQLAQARAADYTQFARECKTQPSFRNTLGVIIITKRYHRTTKAQLAQARAADYTQYARERKPNLRLETASWVLIIIKGDPYGRVVLTCSHGSSLLLKGTLATSSSSDQS